MSEREHDVASHLSAWKGVSDGWLRPRSKPVVGDSSCRKEAWIASPPTRRPELALNRGGAKHETLGGVDPRELEVRQ